AVESLLLSTTTIASPIAFEILGTGSAISVQFCAPFLAANQVQEQLSFHFPEAVVQSTTTNLIDVWQADPVANSLIIDFALSREFLLPLAVPHRSATDPLTPLFAIMEGLTGSETVIYQVLLHSVRHPWALNMY